MLEDNLNNFVIRTTPSMEKKDGLQDAMRAIGALMPQAKARLARLPIREVTDRLTGLPIQCRFATSEELQRIVMEVFKGLVVINTIPVFFGVSPAITAQVCVLTKSGYVVLPGATASQGITVGIGKALLSAESRSIRRAIRDLGLRAEYEVFDPDEDNRLNLRVAVAKPEPSDSALSITPDVDDADSDIPSERGHASNDDALTLDATKKPKPKSKTKQRQKASKSGADKPAIDKQVSIPKNQLKLKVDHDHKMWPNIRATTYLNELFTSIEKARKASGLNVDVFIRQVLGSKNVQSGAVLRSCITTELELLFQFYVIQNGVV
jgi:hypothetical protein